MLLVQVKHEGEFSQVFITKIEFLGGVIRIKIQQHSETSKYAKYTQNTAYFYKNTEVYQEFTTATPASYIY